MSQIAPVELQLWWDGKIVPTTSWARAAIGNEDGVPEVSQLHHRPTVHKRYQASP